MQRVLSSTVGRFHGRLYATDRARDFDHELDRNVRKKQIYESIDRQPYQWVVVLVAGIGFFLDGYTLFVSNIVLPMIAFVYWHDETSTYKGTRINIATLAGTLLGQVLFGVLADKYGRKKMYGIELLLIVAATLGIVMASEGAHHSMNLYSWLIWWRIFVGIGVGADYPLSAIITSEFAPTPHRARMLASVFFMQPLGQVTGNVISLIVVIGFKNQGSDDPIKSVDQMWRLIIGLGVVPGVIALFFRIAIPETPRFISEIEDDPIKAEFDATQLFGQLPFDVDTDMEARQRNDSVPDSILSQYQQNFSTYETRVSTAKMNETDGNFGEGQPGTPGYDGFQNQPTLNSKWNLSRADIHQYFWVEGNWRSLFATSATWLLLDFGFYGISLSNPQFLAKTWGNLGLTQPHPIWMISRDESIWEMFRDTSLYALVILNSGSFIGGICLILLANKVDRVALQKYGFIFLAMVFVTLGVVFVTLQRTGPWAIVLYAIAQFAFNFGPNGTTYIIPAEIFPTRYRASCHGISAATGKLGSIIVQTFAAYYNFGGNELGAENTRRYGTILIIFSVAMLLGAIVTHVWLPDVQYRNRKSKPLEVLARGRSGCAKDDKDGRRRWIKLIRRPKPERAPS